MNVQEMQRIDNVASQCICQISKEFRKVQFRVIDFGLVQRSMTWNSISQNLNSTVPWNLAFWVIDLAAENSIIKYCIENDIKLKDFDLYDEEVLSFGKSMKSGRKTPKL